MFDLQFLIIIIPVILVSITIHEYAHGKVADILGDPTPRLSGRLTLNPISHIDIVGFLALLLVRFGWAKPVPVNPYNFRDPKRAMLYVSLAGPLSNFFFAWILAIFVRTIPFIPPFIKYIFEYAIFLNLALAVFNLIPVPPLDGSKILEGLLPYRYSYIFHQLEQYGFLLLILILIFPGTSYLLISAVNFLFNLLLL